MLAAFSIVCVASVVASTRPQTFRSLLSVIACWILHNNHSLIPLTTKKKLCAWLFMYDALHLCVDLRLVRKCVQHSHIIIIILLMVCMSLHIPYPARGQYAHIFRVFNRWVTNKIKMHTRKRPSLVHFVVEFECDCFACLVISAFHTTASH